MFLMSVLIYLTCAHFVIRTRYLSKQSPLCPTKIEKSISDKFHKVYLYESQDIPDPRNMTPVNP